MEKLRIVCLVTPGNSKKLNSMLPYIQPIKVEYALLVCEFLLSLFFCNKIMEEENFPIETTIVEQSQTLKDLRDEDQVPDSLKTGRCPKLSRAQTEDTGTVGYCSAGHACRLNSVWSHGIIGLAQNA